MKDLEQYINAFEPTSLAEMNAIKLLNRQDTKFVFHEKQLSAVLTDLTKDYKILEIQGKRLMSYENQYFDTKDFKFYNKHQRGMLNRTKIRIRKYVESNLSFIEIKRKTNKSRTVKNRITMKADEHIGSKRITDFIEGNSKIVVDDLKEKMLINFSRITLAHRDNEDRCTIDVKLKASWRGEEHQFDNLVIAELKQDRFRHGSKFNLALKKHHIYSGGFSKYCFSFLNLNKDLKTNNFKLKLHLLNKTLS